MTICELGKEDSGETGIQAGIENMTNEDDTNQDQLAAEPVFVDSDDDSVPDEQDNCPNVANEDQLDSNGNRIGDVRDQEEEQRQEEKPAVTDSFQDQVE